MKIRTFAVLLSLVLTVAAFADGPVRRTVVIRDGKVITDSGDVLAFNNELFGGKRAWLGVSLIDLTDELRDFYGASKDAGILVGSIADDSPAAKAGVKVGDIIVAVDGNDVESVVDLRRVLREKKEGDSVRLDVLRGKSRQSLVATVVEKEATPFFVNAAELPRFFNNPQVRARIESAGDCASLQSRIRELEGRLKELEKKLAK